MRWVPSACRLSAADRARERSGCLSSSAGGGAVRHPESSQTEQGNVASFSQTHRGNVARRAPRAGGGPGTARARGASERGGEGSADAVGPLRPLLRMAVARPWCAIRSEMASCGRRRQSASAPNPGRGRSPWWSPPCACGWRWRGCRGDGTECGCAGPLPPHAVGSVDPSTRWLGRGAAWSVEPWADPSHWGRSGSRSRSPSWRLRRSPSWRLRRSQSPSRSRSPSRGRCCLSVNPVAAWSLGQTRAAAGPELETEQSQPRTSCCCAGARGRDCAAGWSCRRGSSGSRSQSPSRSGRRVCGRWRQDPRGRSRSRV